MDNDTLIQYRHTALAYGSRPLWQDLSLDIKSGEFITILGPNGSGKTSLIRTLLNITALTRGKLEKRAHLRIGYVPQVKSFDTKMPLRGRDLVRFGLDGGSLFLGLFDKKSAKEKAFLVEQALAEVDAQHYADAPLAFLSGGERQRLRIAQALVSQPQILVLDEPLASLDIASQHIICNILQHQKTVHHTAILMVTHEINPVLNLVDKVLYIANGNALVGAPDAILTSEKLSDLFHIPVRVIHENGRVFILVDNHHHLNIQHLEAV